MSDSSKKSSSRPSRKLKGMVALITGADISIG
jgi:hypothetical protein